MTTTFKHADLGELKGNVVDGTAQFLGLKYASLENRFAAPQLVTTYGSGAVDASKYGYVFRTAWRDPSSRIEVLRPSPRSAQSNESLASFSMSYLYRKFPPIRIRKASI